MNNKKKTGILGSLTKLSVKEANKVQGGVKRRHAERAKK